jgi:hypothetical protein
MFAINSDYLIKKSYKQLFLTDCFILLRFTYRFNQKRYPDEKSGHRFQRNLYILNDADMPCSIIKLRSFILYV